MAEAAAGVLPAPGAWPDFPAVRVVGCPHPFRSDRIDVYVEAGGSIVDLLDMAEFDWLFTAKATANIFLGGHRIPRHLWARVRPKAGTTLYVSVLPGGGGGGSNKIFRTILQIAILVISIVVFYWAGGGIWGALAAAAVNLGGNLIVNALIPPPKPQEQNLQRGVPSDPLVSSISGIRNQANTYGPVPKLYGRRKIFPLYGAKPFTEIEGDDQYLRVLFVLGYGPLAIDQDTFKIGDTPIDDFDGVETEVREGYDDDEPRALFSNDVNEEALSVLITHDLDWVARTPEQPGNEAIIDITWLGGLFKFESTGREAVSVTLEARYKLVGAPDWAPAVSMTVFRNQGTPVRRAFRFVAPVGELIGELAVRRITIDNQSAIVQNEFTWTAFRTITYVDPINMDGLATVTLRIKASNQLSGVVDTFNCIATAVLPVWNGSAWVEEETRSPAWAVVDMLSGRANKRAVDRDARVIRDDFEAWAERCATAGFTFDQIFDSRTTVFDALREATAVGRATIDLRDGKFSIVEDLDLPAVQMFTPHNSWGVEWKRTFSEQPHALKIEFVNEDADYDQDERYIYADGYSEDGSEPDTVEATVFETLPMPGVVVPDAIWKHGRYYLAVNELRPETIRFKADIENLICRRGDKVILSYEAILLGLQSGRVKSVITSGTDVIMAVLEERVTMETGKTYAIQLRKEDGGNLQFDVMPVFTEVGETDRLTFITPIPNTEPQPTRGDLFSFGEAGLVTGEFKVKRIEPDEDLHATIEVINAAPEVLTADQGTIPEFVSLVSRGGTAERKPPKPSVVSVRSDEAVLLTKLDGGLQSRIVVSLTPPPNSDVVPHSLHVRYRPTGEEGPWQIIPPLSAAVTEVSVMPVQDGLAYDIVLVYATRAGKASDAREILGHVVIGQTTPPPPVTNVRHENGVIRWTYETRPADFLGFLIRQRPGTDNVTWANGFAGHDGVLTIAEFNTESLGAGTRTVLVEAVDRSGNVSGSPGRVVLDLGDPEISNVVETFDLDAAGFPGIIENGAVTGGELRADDTGDLYLPALAEPYLPDDEDLYLPTEFVEMVWTARTFIDDTALPGDIVISRTIASSYTLEYKLSGSGLFLEDGDALFLEDGDALFLEDEGEWAPWPERIPGAVMHFDTRVTTPAGATRGIVSNFDILLDADDVEETLEDIVIASGGGTRLPITKSYRSIVNVILTLEGSTTALKASYIDKDAELGPLVKCWDASNTSVGGTVDARIKGY